MRVQVAGTLVGNGLLEVGQDLGAVRVVVELGLRATQIGADPLVGVLVELVRLAIQVDRDDFVHG